MNDHNLDDLIIDNIEPKNGKTKSLLTIIALLIVVLIVAIILTKTLLKSPTNPELSFDKSNSEMIAPELKLQEKPATTKEKTADLSLSNMIEEKTTTPKAEVKKPIEIKEETIVIDEEVIIEKEVVVKEEVQKTEVTKPVPEKIEQTKVEKPKIVTKPQTTPKVVKKPTVTPKATSGVKYYVQVGSFAKDPSVRLLSVLKNSGFTYSIAAPEANGNKRVLIGPYSSRAEVDKALKQVRDRITKTAFVFTK